jgi:hypothetical protein
VADPEDIAQQLLAKRIISVVEVFSVNWVLRLQTGFGGRKNDMKCFKRPTSRIFVAEGL